MVHAQRGVSSPKPRKADSPRQLGKLTKKIARWSFAEYQIKPLKFTYKSLAVLPRGSGRHQEPPVLGQGRSVSFRQCGGAAPLVRASTPPPTALSVQSWHEKGASEKVVIDMMTAATFGHLAQSGHCLEPSIITREGG